MNGDATHAGQRALRPQENGRMASQRGFAEQGIHRPDFGRQERPGGCGGAVQRRRDEQRRSLRVGCSTGDLWHHVLRYDLASGEAVAVTPLTAADASRYEAARHPKPVCNHLEANRQVRRQSRQAGIERRRPRMAPLRWRSLTAGRVRRVIRGRISLRLPNLFTPSHGVKRPRYCAFHYGARSQSHPFAMSFHSVRRTPSRYSHRHSCFLLCFPCLNGFQSPLRTQAVEFAKAREQYRGFVEVHA